jgi:hypothetical protein
MSGWDLRRPISNAITAVLFAILFGWSLVSFDRTSGKVNYKVLLLVTLLIVASDYLLDFLVYFAPLKGQLSAGLFAAKLILRLLGEIGQTTVLHGLWTHLSRRCGWRLPRNATTILMGANILSLVLKVAALILEIVHLLVHHLSPSLVIAVYGVVVSAEIVLSTLHMIVHWGTFLNWMGISGRQAPLRKRSLLKSPLVSLSITIAQTILATTLTCISVKETVKPNETESTISANVLDPNKPKERPL